MQCRTDIQSTSSSIKEGVERRCVVDAVSEIVKRAEMPLLSALHESSAPAGRDWRAITNAVGDALLEVATDKHRLVLFRSRAARSSLRTEPGGQAVLVHRVRRNDDHGDDLVSTGGLNWDFTAWPVRASHCGDGACSRASIRSLSQTPNRIASA